MKRTFGSSVFMELCAGNRLKPGIPLITENTKLYRVPSQLLETEIPDGAIIENVVELFRALIKIDEIVELDVGTNVRNCPTVNLSDNNTELSNLRSRTRTGVYCINTESDVFKFLEREKIGLESNSRARGAAGIEKVKSEDPRGSETSRNWKSRMKEILNESIVNMHCGEGRLIARIDGKEASRMAALIKSLIIDFAGIIVSPNGEIGKLIRGSGHDDAINEIQSMIEQVMLARNSAFSKALLERLQAGVKNEAAIYFQDSSSNKAASAFFLVASYKVDEVGDKPIKIHLC